MKMYMVHKANYVVFAALLVFSFYLSLNRIAIHIQKISGEDDNHLKTRIFIFFGTRPEVIKLAPVIKSLKLSGHFDVRTIFTGQHPDLITSFVSLFNIIVDFSFDKVMTTNQSLPMLISKIMVMADKLISLR